MDANHYIDPAPLRSLPARITRPRVYTDEILYELCERIGNGEKLHDICKDGRMPTAFTVCHWRQTDPKFDAAYEAALLARAEKRCDDMEAIAADGSNDYETDWNDDVPTVKPNKESLGRSQLRIEQIKWRLARELPKRYGDPQPSVQVVAPAVTPALAGPEGTKIDVRSLIDSVSMRGTSVAVK